MQGTSAAQAKVWRGSTSEQRSDERRQRLLVAGLEIFGTTGYHSSTVSGLCSAATVSTRTFYELFNQRADLLEAIYAQVTDQIRVDIEQLPTPTVADIEQWAGDAVRAVVGPLLADLRACQIIEIEVVGLSEQIEERRRQTTLAIAQGLDAVQLALTDPAAPQPSRADRELVGVFVVGGISESLVAHLRTPPADRRSAEELLDMMTAILLRVLKP
ncbi:TetR/AcrR family transcriptional regulator [Nocardioides sp.]|uniref:TetR/AcrR family transcriptional regulator n=1 Tax=Nocardioides sp. TaxID=35761 RepID=UPI00286D8AED|nr:TetR/AcrR family transcriptional regulator [Nocardioides sp.]